MYNIVMRVRLTKWGNSWGIRLPKIFAMHIGMQDGGELEMDVRKHSIVLSNPEFSLAVLLEQATPATLHGESDTGDVVGKEVW